MPSGVRRLSRGSRGTSTPHTDPVNPLKGMPGLPMFEPPSLPKHYPFPTIVMDTDNFYECIMACFTIFGAVAQFMHLYRSVWWLPNSFMPMAMNFYLIDFHLVLLINLIFLRRVYYMTGCRIISQMYSHKTPEDLSFLSRSILSMFYAAIIGILATIVLGERSKMDIIYLFYPISVYIPMFGLQVRPFFEIRAWCSHGIPPLHACNTSSADVRIECQHLKTNFLDKLRQIFFTATMNAYYASFIPCCFAQPELVYDRWWNIELGFFIFASSLVHTYCQLIPLRYCDVLHRAVLHSGMWEKLDGEKSLSSGKYEFSVAYEWRDDIIWPQGAVVKYNKYMWRAIGDSNAIVPGDRALSWGYQLFISPPYTVGIVATFQCLVVMYQLYCVMYATYWYRIISIGFILFFNYYSLYHLLRDLILGHHIYKQSEDSEDEKDQSDPSGQNSPKTPKNLKNKPENPPFVFPVDRPLTEEDYLEYR